MSMKTVKLEEATNAELRWYAGVKLGLDGIKEKGQQNAFLIGKIKAVEPDAEDISVPDESEAPRIHPEADINRALAAAETDVRPAPAPAPEGRAAFHEKYDPKVRVVVSPTNDKTRPRRVFLTCNGGVIEIQRGKEVDIPYRYLEVLRNAEEKRSVQTDETNPVTGLPHREISMQPSYPFSIIQMPPADEIAAWHERTKDAQL